MSLIKPDTRISIVRLRRRERRRLRWKFVDVANHLYGHVVHWVPSRMLALYHPFSFGKFWIDFLYEQKKYIYILENNCHLFALLVQSIRLIRLNCFSLTKIGIKLRNGSKVWSNFTINSIGFKRAKWCSVNFLLIESFIWQRSYNRLDFQPIFNWFTDPFT